MPNTVECPNCKKWYPSNEANVCPFCGFKATAYQHVKVGVNVSGSARAYVEVIAESVLHPNKVSIIDRVTGSVIARFSPEEFTLEKAKYPRERYIIV